MHYFRGIAILCVCLEHISSITVGHKGLWNFYMWNMSVDVLFQASSIFFAFISGYLCELTSRTTVMNSLSGIIKFYLRKIKNVIMPFCLVTFSLFVLGQFFHVLNIFATSFDGLLKTLFGGPLHLWFIPFICTCFLVYPILTKVDDHRLFKLICFLSVVSLLISRPKWGVNFVETLLTFIWFFPSFLAGILYFRQKEHIQKFIFDNKFSLLVLSLVCFFSSIFIISHNTPPFNNWLTSYYFVKKFAEIGLIVFVLSSLEPLIKKNVWLHFTLDLLAKYSFGLYFVHFPIFLIINNFFDPWFYTVWPNQHITTLLRIVLIFITSFFFCISLKYITGKYSRMIIGC